MNKKLKSEYKKDLRLAKTNETYHRKQMEYFKENIKILKDAILGDSE